ncbi:hypothetical protein BJ322DRAFT_1022152 [Thelephora terrestris]|uniref:Uncharacterized protein n=1 Tax=Thelephora terrestris TaxID=56493 RepID=A0A9P6HBU4_9AGAM|nr:hypothetical protein BJ322DRAFT_1022152 [Thelephora terrestris]
MSPAQSLYIPFEEASIHYECAALVRAIAYYDTAHLLLLISTREHTTTVHLPPQRRGPQSGSEDVQSLNLWPLKLQIQKRRLEAQMTVGFLTSFIFHSGYSTFRQLRTPLTGHSMTISQNTRMTVKLVARPTSTQFGWAWEVVNMRGAMKFAQLAIAITYQGGQDNGAEEYPQGVNNTTRLNCLGVSDPGVTYPVIRWTPIGNRLQSHQAGVISVIHPPGPRRLWRWGSNYYQPRVQRPFTHLYKTDRHELQIEAHGTDIFEHLTMATNEWAWIHASAPRSK